MGHSAYYSAAKSQLNLPHSATLLPPVTGKIEYAGLLVYFVQELCATVKVE